ncbi:hypothetical protein DL766_008745 [Monosporascus sp. MC13-8B]|uniref:GmrSD restriction endonucleases C-terminal domain-containing protein n=1 Tax=Monosporascus cannonballus TaxID=155416 RepID=A0ABY0HJQ8_9PEZI|nr:hypothetical protein DL763_008295 [Monosporascus cannonballus]RYO95071.1 hypothetical protein DL762_000264 [Monosporascus cannonballus]RYP18129.1 hypothetical protein DL766_008745 [Monosporascus sp. MC13-8B]
MKFSYALSGLLSAVAVLALPTPDLIEPDLLKRTPPGIPSPSSARRLLSGLKRATPIDDGTYDRDLFPHWQSVEGTCNAREYVLRRDGTGVEVGNDCYPTAGSWTSPYDGGRHVSPPDIDIDHMVPLKNAWISGASAWTTDRRRAFANDIDSPQLWAVTDSVNRSKGDKSPDKWKPPLRSFHCTYAASWIAVKDKYALSASIAEVGALGAMLDTC